MWKLTEGPDDPPELLAAYMRWVLGTGTLYIWHTAEHYGDEGPSEVHTYENIPKHLRTWESLKNQWLEIEKVHTVGDHVEGH